MAEFHHLVMGATGVYLIVLLSLGFMGRRARLNDSLSDHYLGGRSFGVFVLLMTLFATQYSGNSLVGFPGKAYRSGAAYFMSVTFMIAIVAGYTLFVPQLRKLSERFQFLTPGDFIRQRWQNEKLVTLANAIFILTLVNFLLAQLMALGHAFSVVSAGEVSYEWSVIIGATVILICEILGGMRAVAWTDVSQGLILILGLVFIMIMVTLHVGSPAEIFESLAQAAPDKLSPPDQATCLQWFSMLILLGLGGPLYPQAIQRIYAAKSSRELKISMSLMALLPLIAVTSVIWLGLVGLSLFPGLEASDSEGITFLVLKHLFEMSPTATIPVILIMVSVTAAIMSTADSALLSLSSIISHDFWQRRSPDKAITAQMANRVSLIIIILVAGVALLKVGTLWAILKLKFEILIQLVPTVILGACIKKDSCRSPHSQSVYRGILVGLVITLTLYFTGHKMIGGVSAGVIGLAANLIVVCLSSRNSERQA